MKNIGDAAAALLAYQAGLRDTPTAATRHALAPASQVLAGVGLPTNTREAYALQDELIRQTGGVAGWKVGGARAPEPNCAPVFASVLWDDATPLPFDIAPETEYRLYLCARPAAACAALQRNRGGGCHRFYARRSGVAGNTVCATRE